MPKVLPEYLELRRQQILDAAAACFARRGFHQATMQDICDEAQLSPGAVYRYFHSKEEIIEAMCEESARHNSALIEAAKERGDTLAVLDELASVFFGMLEDMEACALEAQLWAEGGPHPQVTPLFPP